MTDEHAVPPLLLDDASTEEIASELLSRVLHRHPFWLTFVAGGFLGLLIAGASLQTFVSCVVLAGFAVYAWNRRRP